MTIMTTIDPARLQASSALIESAFEHARNARHQSENVAPKLHQDLDILQSVIYLTKMYGLDEQSHADVIDLMNTPTFRAMSNHLNTLMAPDVYAQFAHTYPNSAQAYLKLQSAIGQLEQAVQPASDIFALADGPVVR